MLSSIFGAEQRINEPAQRSRRPDWAWLGAIGK